MTAANSTEPTVGAAVWASGSQVCSGHIGTLTANPRNIAPKTSHPNRPANTSGVLAAMSIRVGDVEGPLARPDPERK